MYINEYNPHKQKLFGVPSKFGLESLKGLLYSRLYPWCFGVSSRSVTSAWFPSAPMKAELLT